MAHLSDLDFLKVSDEDARRWDGEWCRYLLNYEPSRYFTNLSDSSHRHHTRARTIPGLSRDEMYTTQGPMSRLSIWVDGRDLSRKNVLEIGCGPSQLGRDLATVVNKYIGIDYSDLALKIADATTPDNCFFINLRDKKEICLLESTIDTIICRHFFIHQNYENASWLFRLAKFLLKEGGVFTPDFFASKDETITKGMLDKGTLVDAESPLQAFPSTMFQFKDSQIKRLTDAYGFQKEAEKFCSEFGRRIIRLRAQGVSHGA